MMEGVINLLKPPGMTSSDAVTDIRRIYHMKRVGHTGTLDPGAAGVLPICLGRATRIFDYLMDKRKTYIAEVCFGRATDTQDSYGTVTARSDARVTEDMVKAVLPAFTGEIEQIAPMYSAVHFEGKKLYQLAREGAETVERVRSISIHGLEYIGMTDENRFRIRIECSKGTYIRTLCADIGEALGVPSHMSFLMRTQSGAFNIDDAYTVAELIRLKEEDCLAQTVTPIEDALSMLPQIRLVLDERDERLLINGAEIASDALEAFGTETAARTYVNGVFTGIGLAYRGRMHMKLNLAKGGEDA